MLPPQPVETCCPWIWIAKEPSVFLLISAESESMVESVFVSEHQTRRRVLKGETKSLAASSDKRISPFKLWMSSLNVLGFFYFVFCFTKSFVVPFFVSCQSMLHTNQPCQGWTSRWLIRTRPESLKWTTGPSSVSPRRPRPRRPLPPHQGARATSMFTCGSSSACWCSCWPCSSSPSTGWRTSSPPLPRCPTAAAREGAPSPTWRSAASHLRGPPSPRCLREGGHAFGAWPGTFLNAWNKRKSMHRTEASRCATTHYDILTFVPSMALLSIHVPSNPTALVSLSFHVICIGTEDL